MPYPFITRVGSSNPDFPLKVGEKLRIKNPDGTRDTITLVANLTPAKARGKASPLFAAVTSRAYFDSNKRQMGTPWTF